MKGKNQIGLKKTAFSLIELSVVILVISILAAGALSVSTVSLVNAKNKVTKERMEAIYKAIGTFVARNYRLPCPASLTIAKSSANYGTEDGSGDCATQGDGIYTSTIQSNIVYGMVPVKALGLADDVAEDGFGTKIAYIVNAKFTEAEYPTATDTDGFSFYEDTGSDMINIYQLPSTNNISNAVFVLLSHGANKYGGFNKYSTSQNSTLSAETYEGYNSLSSVTDNTSPTIDTASFGVIPSNPTEVSITLTNSDSDDFDDIAFYKTRDQLLIDFDLGFLLPCTSSTTNWTSGFSNAFAGTVANRATDCASPNEDITPTMLCGPLAASWVAKVSCP